MVAVLIAIAVVVLHRPASRTDPQGNPTVPAGQIAGPTGPEAVPLEEGDVLAPATGAASGQTVDGISCDSDEQVAYHIHAHLAVYVDGALHPIPPGIGVVEPVAQQSAQGPFYQASRCYYWLHVHAQDGIIHIEAPTQSDYTLGQFFAIWQQPLSSTAVGPVSGAQTVYVNGKVYTGNPSEIPLSQHEVIQINVNSPGIAPQTVDWSKAQL